MHTTLLMCLHTNEDEVKNLDSHTIGCLDHLRLVLRASPAVRILRRNRSQTPVLGERHDPAVVPEKWGRPLKAGMRQILPYNQAVCDRMWTILCFATVLCDHLHFESANIDQMNATIDQCFQHTVCHDQDAPPVVCAWPDIFKSDFFSSTQRGGTMQPCVAPGGSQADRTPLSHKYESGCRAIRVRRRSTPCRFRSASL